MILTSGDCTGQFFLILFSRLDLFLCLEQRGVALSSWKINRRFSKTLTITATLCHTWKSNSFRYFMEFKFPLIGITNAIVVHPKNIQPTLIGDMRWFFLDVFLNKLMELFCPITTCVLSENITFCHLLVCQCLFPRHHKMWRCRLLPVSIKNEVCSKQSCNDHTQVCCNTFGPQCIFWINWPITILTCNDHF